MDTLQKPGLFWDVSELHPEKHEQFIVERILNFGDADDFRWAFRRYGAEKMKACLLRNTTLDKKSFSFWCRYFHLNATECTNVQSTRKHGAFWNR